MPRVIWSDRALDDVSRIVAYISQFDPGAAERIGERLFALGEGLALFPDRGRPASGGAREHPAVRPYVMRYHRRDDMVVIVGVRHGRRRPLGASRP